WVAGNERSGRCDIEKARLIHNTIIFAVGFVASAINAFAFGGSRVSFPTLIWLGMPPIIANATNTAAVWPGSLGAVWGYRRELRQTAPHMYWLIVPSVAGGRARGGGCCLV